MTEKCKRIQIRNVLEEKSLQEKIRLFTREQRYVDKELRQILHAKESLLQSLRRANLGVSPRTAELLERARRVHDKGRTLQSKTVKDATGDVEVKSLLQRRPSEQEGEKKLDGKLVSDCATQTIERLPVNNKQCPTTNTDILEIKSCLHVGKHKKRNSHVRFSFPEIKSEKSIESTEDDDGKVFQQRQRQYVYKSHSDCLDDIQVKSKFFQIGSVALATAIFKSNTWQSKTSYSGKAHNGTKEVKLKKQNDNETTTAHYQTTPKKPTLRRIKSGYLSSEPRQKLLIRRQSMMF